MYLYIKRDQEDKKFLAMPFYLIFLFDFVNFYCLNNNYLGNFVTAMFYKLQESVCNTIHHLLDKNLVDKKITNFRRLKQIKETTTPSTLDKDVTYKKFT